MSRATARTARRRRRRPRDAGPVVAEVPAAPRKVTAVMQVPAEDESPLDEAADEAPAAEDRGGMKIYSAILGHDPDVGPAGEEPPAPRPAWQQAQLCLQEAGDRLHEAVPRWQRAVLTEVGRALHVPPAADEPTWRQIAQHLTDQASRRLADARKRLKTARGDKAA